MWVWGGGGRTGQGRVGQGEVLAGGVGAISFICDALYQPNTHCFTFHEDIPQDYLFMACTRTALEIYQRDVTTKYGQKTTHGS